MTPPRETSRPPRPHAPREADSPGLASRRAALALLARVRGGTMLDDALATSRSLDALESAPDRAFTRHLVTTVLRRRNSLDELYDQFLERPLKPAQAELRDLLRLAAAQIAILKTPAHAAASTSVELAKERRETAGFSGLVNALCRRLADLPEDAADRLPLRTDTPGWLWRALSRAYGTSIAGKIAAAHRAEPPLDLAVKPDTDRAALADRLGGTLVGPASIRLRDAGPVVELDGFADGTFWVQDVAATLPAAIFGEVAGKTAYDLCAAPGGKTLQLVAAGADVTAVDISPRRLDRLEENLNRTGLEARVVASDFLEWTPEHPADLVLLDAPCTATGTIRRHPDLLWSKQEGDADTLSALQDRMLDKASSLTAPGGCLVFSTCSLLPREGEERMDAFLARHPEFSLEPVRPGEVGGLPVIAKSGAIRCLPSHLGTEGGMDGFFAARFRRQP